MGDSHAMIMVTIKAMQTVILDILGMMITLLVYRLMPRHCSMHLIYRILICIIYIVGDAWF